VCRAPALATGGLSFFSLPYALLFIIFTSPIAEGMRKREIVTCFTIIIISGSRLWMESKKKSCCIARFVVAAAVVRRARWFVCERVDPTGAGFDGNQIELKATQG
jgi:hypothetical protein